MGHIDTPVQGQDSTHRGETQHQPIEHAVLGKAAEKELMARLKDRVKCNLVNEEGKRIATTHYNNQEWGVFFL